MLRDIAFCFPTHSPPEREFLALVGIYGFFRMYVRLNVVRRKVRKL